MIEHGELAREQLLGFAVQLYLLNAKVSPRPTAALYARCPDDREIERLLLRELVAEGASQLAEPRRPRDLFVDFLEHLGLNREAADAAESLPETAGLLAWREMLFSHGPWLEAAAAHGYALDGTAAGRAGGIAPGLPAHYELPVPMLACWRLETELAHSAIGELAVARLAHTEEQQLSVRQAIAHTLDIFWAFLDGVKRCYVEEDASYERWRDWLRANTSTRS